MSAEYHKLLDHVLTEGVPRHGEKPEGTLTIFGYQIKFDLSEGFPLITTRDMTLSWERIIPREALWMISGSTSATEAENQFGLKLWNRWAEDSRKKLGTPEGELGPIYGHQLRRWNGKTDQLSVVVDMLKKVPETRRAVVSLWNIDDVERDGVKVVNVANCTTMLHFSRMKHRTTSGVLEDQLDLATTHRSMDLAAGAPHDWPTWALIQMIVARELGIPPGTLVSTIEDGQIYDIQIEKVKLMLEREPLPKPTVTIEATTEGMFELQPNQFTLHEYHHHGRIFMPTAI